MRYALSYVAQHAKPSVTVTGDSNLHKLWCIRARVRRSGFLAEGVVFAHHRVFFRFLFFHCDFEHPTLKDGRKVTARGGFTAVSFSVYVKFGTYFLGTRSSVVFTNCQYFSTLGM